MKRSWIGLALLAVSCQIGVGCYHQADWLAWAILVAAGALLLAGTVQRAPKGAGGAWALLALAPALWLMPWPWRAAPLLIALGLVLCLPPAPRRWPKRLGSVGIAAGLVLLAQFLGLYAYEVVTARSHELPWPLPQMLGGIARLLSVEAATDGHAIALHSMRKAHLLGATWELLVDPATLCFLAGGMALLALRMWTSVPRGRRASAWMKCSAVLAGVVILWLPIRAALLMSLHLHRALRTDYEAPLNLMNQFFSPWVLLLLLAGPVLLVWRFLRCPAPSEEDEPAPAPPTGKWRRVAATALAFAAILLLTAAVFWDPVGRRKTGRVIIDEHHSQWEPTGRPYDTEWYGTDSGYNYACLYDYLSRFYDISRLAAPMDDAALSNCDVLMLKAPTSPYTRQEVDAVRRFVERGGGLMLVGEHTDVFGTGVNLNQIANEFGFRFRYDVIFDLDTGFEQRYRPSVVPHPIVQHIPALDWAVSCSIAPGASAGRAVIRCLRAWNLPPDYHASNFYPQMEARADMRYGAFIQLWATSRRAGRVVAFTDSTQGSNFCLFDEGKSELLLGMTEWLNHANPFPGARTWLAIAGTLLLAGALVLAWAWPEAWLPLIAAGILGWCAAVVGVQAAHRTAMPFPKNVRPMVRVIVDRTVSTVGLSKSGFIGGKSDEFGLFERWILRLGYFTKRASGPDALKDDLLVVVYPRETVTMEYRDEVARYVAEGGKLLVLDSPENLKSTANSLLYPYEMSLRKGAAESGALTTPAGWPQNISVASAWEVAGGVPCMTINGKPVAATARHGKGMVAVIAFGSRFSDASMGVTGDVVPDAALRNLYELEFTLLRALIAGNPIELPKPPVSPPPVP